MHPPGVDPVFACPGEMAGRFASRDWAATPLGPPDGWSPSLRVAVSILLRSRLPMILTWGADLRMLYNDAYIPTIGAKHPRAFTEPLESQFPEMWHEIGPLQHGVLEGGGAHYAEDLALPIDKGAGNEIENFTFSYSHVADDAGSGPGGVLAVFAVTTGKVVGARRLALLNALGACGPEARDTRDAVTRLLAALAAAVDDLDHGACYLPAREQLQQPEQPEGSGEPGAGLLVRAGGFGPGDAGADLVLPERLDVGEDPADLVAQAWTTGRTQLGPGPAGDPPAHRVALPIHLPDGVAGVLVLGPNRLRPLDEDHRSFLELVGTQVSQVVGLASARAEERARLASLAALDAAKTALLSNISHEFRTPLTLLLGPLEDALAEPGATVARRDVEEMHASAHRLLRMVNGLLSVMRADATGPASAAPEPVDLPGATSDLLQPFVTAAARGEVSLELALDPGLGVVETDPSAWETIVVNLVANALKFTPAGSVTVSLGADPADPRQLLLAVTDTGIGIAPEHVGRVFDRFHRASGSEVRQVAGTGVGLALVSDAVTSQGGHTAVTSELGVGSRFEVRLPLRRPAPDSAPAPRRPDGSIPALAADVVAPPDTATDTALATAAGQPTGGEEAAGSPHEPGRPRILAVDDNAAMRRRLSLVLADLGEVVTAADGVEALETLRADGADLVVTDVMMPRLDGLGLLEAVRADPVLRHVPVLVLSARAGAEAATWALEVGADDYVVKPFTRGELLARCRTSLELSRLRGDAAASEARATLLAGVSHDMQTPLSIVAGALQVLGGDLPDPAARRWIATRAQSRADQLDRLVRQFLDWSRLSAGVRIEPRLEEVELATLVEEVVAEYDDAHVAPLGELAGVTVHCDRRRTEQVLHNLVSNAARVASTVEVRVAAADGGFDVEVHDDGPGVAQEVLPHLFTAFSPTTRPGGNGLGLHVSREAARAQGGDLILSSTGPSGSVFVLHLDSEIR